MNDMGVLKNTYIYKALILKASNDKKLRTT